MGGARCERGGGGSSVGEGGQSLWVDEIYADPKPGDVGRQMGGADLCSAENVMRDARTEHTGGIDNAPVTFQDLTSPDF